MSNEKQKSWYSRIFGRSFIRILCGDFFTDKNNAASIIAIMLVASVCYLVIFQEKFDYANGLFNIVFTVVGYYFGAKREASSDLNED